MGGCSTYQIRKIYAIGQALGIVNRGGEDALHNLPRKDGKVNGPDSL